MGASGTNSSSNTPDISPLKGNHAVSQSARLRDRPNDGQYKYIVHAVRFTERRDADAGGYFAGVVLALANPRQPKLLPYGVDRQSRRQCRMAETGRTASHDQMRRSFRAHAQCKRHNLSYRKQSAFRTPTAGLSPICFPPSGNSAWSFIESDAPQLKT